MEEILQTTLLEYDKSSFLIDLIKHHSGEIFIAIQQDIHAGDKCQTQKIKINPSILDDVLEVLNNYKNKVSQKNPSVRNYFSTERKEEVKKRYFKGLEIKDLALQFNCSENIIEQILNNSGIEIVSNKVPEEYKWKHRRKRK